ncbi:septum site-determining protein MinC [Chitinilyticum piscinae]|uniref:Probable septum site-determining protein MinC n=1 Tax=Chitinilyticum piscinae TaxID=2866724 RepID=A0A8J7FJZ5_9NEIS|nr:septum site-determining protein MinC [Chitinilyticum piscinae]MBE9609302.1 septum site-determining protein MinC [Chitinilyticum piscinae]
MNTRSSDITLFEFKSVGLNVLSFVPVTLDTTQLETALGEKIGRGQHFLSGSQLALDFDALPEIPTAIDVKAVIMLLQQFYLHAVACKGGNTAQQAAAREAGLIVLDSDSILTSAPGAAANSPAEEVVTPAPAAAAERNPALIITRPVRTGQQVYARGGDLIVTALVSAGAELIADGNIHVYAPLRGRALAGARGDTMARVFTTCMEAELVSIAGVYRTLDDSLPASIRSKPSQVYLDQDKLVIEALQGTN